MFSVIFGFIGFSMLNIAQVLQKMGLGTRRKNEHRGTWIWLAGMLGSLLASAINFLAVILGSASLTGAMAGTGLLRSSGRICASIPESECFGCRKAAGIVCTTAGFSR
ncbi:MAG: hypothetical protein EHM28_00535 [Spirochaetaceae bacterium]|nr:MAG: hypothetical protein EHM28_00535 [Spirochaetaceae bacterium]